MSGPQLDGTARARDRLGTYEGARYTEPEDLDRMRSSQVVSDYLYEATDPFTDTTVIVDATPLSPAMADMPTMDSTNLKRTLP